MRIRATYNNTAVTSFVCACARAAPSHHHSIYAASFTSTKCKPAHLTERKCAQAAHLHFIYIVRNIFMRYTTTHTHVFVADTWNNQAHAALHTYQSDRASAYINVCVYVCLIINDNVSGTYAGVLHIIIRI